MAPVILADASSTAVPDAEPAGDSAEPGEPARTHRSVARARRANSRSSWRILGQRDFCLYFIGSLISNLGTFLQSTVQVLIAYQVTHSVFTVGLIASAQFAGMIVVSPWAPVLAYRFSPRAVLVGTQGFSALIAVSMAWLHFERMLGVNWLLAGALCLGFAYALALPVQTALVPALVSEDDAADAVKMNSVSYNAGRALAPALCVPVLILLGPGLIFAANAVSFVIFVFILRRLKHIASDVSFRHTFAGVLRASLNRTMNPVDETFTKASAMRPRARVRDGLVTVLRRRRLLLLLAIVAAVTLGDDPVTVLSPAVAARLHVSGASAGYLIAALGWGSVLGSLPPTSARNSDAQRASKHAAVSLLILGVSIVVFTMGFSFRASLAAAVVAGAAALFTGTAAQTALLRHHKKEGMDVAAVASVAALWAIAWAGTKPFASLLDGWLASRHGILFTGIALTAPAIIIALCELLLPNNAKRIINDCGNWVADHIAPPSDSPAPIGPGPEPQPASDGVVFAGAPPVPSSMDQGGCAAALAEC